MTCTHEPLTLDVAVADLAAVVGTLVVDDDQRPALEPGDRDGACAVPGRDDATDRHEADLVQLRPPVVRVVAEDIEDLRIQCGAHRTTLRARSDVSRARLSQVRAILALVGDLHYLRSNVAAVLVHIDLDGDRPHPSSLVALAAGRQLASSWGATLYAALIKHDPSAGVGLDSAVVASGTAVPGVDSIEDQVTRFGADKLVVAVTEAQVAPLWALVGNAWQGVIDHLRPRVVLFGASSPSAHELGPRTGARIGARLLTRARTVGGDEIELRDRDGAHVRIGDSGAAVALIGHAEHLMPQTGNEVDDIDVVALSVPARVDENLSLGAVEPAKSGTTRSVLIALADDLVSNDKLVADATRLAAKLDGQLVIGKGAGKGGGKLPGAISVDATVPLAPDVCVAIGKVSLDVAGASSLIRIGGPSDKTADGLLPAPADISLASLVKTLEDA